MVGLKVGCWIVLLLLLHPLAVAQLIDPEKRAAIVTGKDSAEKSALGIPDVDYELVKKEIPLQGPDYDQFDYLEPGAKHYECSLKLPGRDASIFLGRVYYEPGEDHGEVGFDEKSLQVKWLDPGKLLHVSWETLNQGNGHFTMDSNLLLIKGTAAEWQEVFRDTARASERWGWMQSYRSEHAFAYDSSLSVLSICLTEYTFGTIGENDPFAPFASREKEGDTGPEYILAGHTIITQWRYKVVQDGIRFLDGEKYLDLEDSEMSLNAVAALLASIDGKKDTAEYSDMLKSNNPSLADQGICKGRLLIGHPKGAYVEDHNLYYRLNTQ